MGRPKKEDVRDKEAADMLNNGMSSVYTGEGATKAEVDAVKQDLSRVTDALLTLSGKIEEVLAVKKPVQSIAPVTSESSATRMPASYRQIIDEILSHRFPATVEWRTDGNFELTIDVPAEYSNATASHLSVYKKDMRVKVIPNALAENGVRDYVQAVAKNLGEIIMNKVREDKAK